MKNKEQKMYDVALATRNFEIELFWKRSVFFWGFIASAFIGYATAIKNSPSLALLIACFGLVCSVAWSLVNRGSKYWQENWETIVAEIEDDITGSLFKKRGKQQNKGFWLSSRKFSVSKVTIALSDFTVIFWLCVMGYHLLKVFNLTTWVSLTVATVLIILISLIFSCIMIWSGKSTEAE